MKPLFWRLPFQPEYTDHGLCEIPAARFRAPGIAQ
jgi:hypothetical protein